ncbi:MFS transporter [Kutzneria kofuensis]|uniref:MFS family permease n=1 Tax=Kutzneria kofuensis TaxID=103725 RepID=A0A7W9KRP6_9PSEU|nr:MFS transporter [Kutzneria kofuensis]MBB5897511.1 MFS family permease [Kutzneria kofuensis]
MDTALLRRLGVEPARPRVVARWPHAHWLAVAAVCLGAFMGQLDASIVTLTFPALSREFGASLAGVQWVSLSYLLTLVALLLPVGRLADAVGRKLLYLYGFAVFTVASAACGFADSLPLLVGLRVVQAVGAAMLQANSVALVTTSSPRQSMRAALGVQAAAQAVGLALGPTLGGVLVASVGWQWVFWVNVPIGLVAIAAGRYLLPRTRQRTAMRSVDWPGVALLGSSSTGLLLGLSALSGLDAPVWAVVMLFIVAAATGVGFVLRQRRAAEPLVDLNLLRDGVIASGLVAAMLGYLVLFGPLVLVPVLGGSVVRAGFVLTSLPVGFALAATFGGSRWPDRLRALAGGLVCVAALIPLCLLPLTDPVLAISLAALGIGLGLFTPANNATVMAAIPAACSGVGGGLVNMARGLGTTLGVASVTLALHGHGPRAAMIVLLVAAFGLVVVSRRQPA